MFTPTFRLPWDYLGCGTPRIELVKNHNHWRACLFNFNVDSMVDGFDADTLEELSDIFTEAAEYIKRTDAETPCLFESAKEGSDELQSRSEPRTEAMGPECC